MNIGEQFYCSKCLRIMDDEKVCPYCGYDPSDETDNRSLMEGTLLHNARYQLGAVLGQGGFGITYAAWDLTLDMPVAIKEYFPKGFCDRDSSESDDVRVGKSEKVYYQFGLQTFIREACVLASMQNIPSVVRVYDCFEENKTAYIIMEFVRGENMVDYCEKNKVSPEKLLRMFRNIIDDLVRIHHAGVVHRDISPYNLLVQEDGVIRLIDFGASTHIYEKERKIITLNRNFAAPEQFDLNENQGVEVDIYALAATMYALMTNQVPQDAQSRLQKDELKRPRQINRRISRRISSSIIDAMRLDPRKRTQSMENLQADLYNTTRPLRTRAQKIIFAAKVLAFVVLLEMISIVGTEFLSERYPRQIELAAQALLLNDSQAAYTLAVNYQYGQLAEERFSKNEKRADYWYRWASDHGSIEAAVDYACMLQQKETDEDAQRRAVQYYKQAAEIGNPIALNNLGMAYMEGRGVECDKELALNCFEQSADAGYTLAMVNLGKLYLQGLGVEKDEGTAVAYFQQAADRGDAEGVFYLGQCYENGYGVEFDSLQCMRCYYEAAELGLGEAMFAIGELYRTGEFGFCDYQKAKEWYTKSFQAGYGGGSYGMGILYRDGLGVEQNLNEAVTNMFIALMYEYEPAKEELDELIDADFSWGNI